MRVIAIIIAAVLTVGYFYFGHDYYVCTIMKLCPDDQDTTMVVEEEPEPIEDPIVFNWTESEAITTDKFAAYRNGILDGLQEDNVLQITAFYFEEEDDNELGLERAEAIKALFADDIPEERISLRARVETPPADAEERPFPAYELQWLEPEKVASSTVEELDDRVIIRFPVGSTQKTYDPAVDEYLEKLATRAQETGEQITLTGHTDDTGDPQANQSLGTARARAIQNILVQYGVAADQISIESRGETQPVASNETEAGRRENRRVEVRLIKEEGEE